MQKYTVFFLQNGPESSKEISCVFLGGKPAASEASLANSNLRNKSPGSVELRPFWSSVASQRPGNSLRQFCPARHS